MKSIHLLVFVMEKCVLVVQEVSYNILVFLESLLTSRPNILSRPQSTLPEGQLDTTYEHNFMMPYCFCFRVMCLRM